MRHLRRTRILARRGDRALVFFAPIWAYALFVALTIAVATVAIIAGKLLAGAVVIVVLLAIWLGLALQVTRLAPAGRGNRPPPPGGAGVREPRHPLPNAPAGAAAMPIPHE